MLPGTSPFPDGEIKAPVRKRRGFPVLPTLMVLIAVPILIGFGFWQLQRMQWKDALLVELTPVVPSAQRIGTVGEYHGGKRILLR